MNFFFLDNFLKIENTNLKFYNIADILIYNISVSSLLSVDIIDNILQITTKNNDVYKLEFMDNNQLLSAKQIILNIINGSTDYIGINGKYRELSTYYTLSGFIDTIYSGNNILRLKDKSNISKYLLLMNTIRSTTVQNHILVISMYEKSIPLRFLTHDDAKNAKIVLDDYILNNSDPGGGGGGTITNHSQLVLDDGTNPHGTTKSDVGLGNVDNTSDMNKPISISTQNALDDKVDKVPGMGLSQENFTTSLKDKLDGIESGAEVNVQADWAQSDNTADDYIKNKPTIPTVLNNHSQLTLDDGTNPHGTTKSDVGLGNVDNTSDMNKPISTATQTALNGKEDVANKAIDFSIINDDLYPTVKAVNDLVESLPIGQLLREEFTYVSGLQIFTLTSNFSQVYSVDVQGQGALSLSQYTLINPNQVEILDILDPGDYVVVVYSTLAVSTLPYYSQGQVDTLLTNKLSNDPFAIISGIGYTPEDQSNKAIDFSVVNDNLYPSVKAVDDQLNLKFDIPSGTNVQYLDGLGNPTTFPSLGIKGFHRFQSPNFSPAANTTYYFGGNNLGLLASAATNSTNNRIRSMVSGKLKRGTFFVSAGLSGALVDGSNIYIDNITKSTSYTIALNFTWVNFNSISFEPISDFIIDKDDFITLRIKIGGNGTGGGGGTNNNFWCEIVIG